MIAETSVEGMKQNLLFSIALRTDGNINTANEYKTAMVDMKAKKINQNLEKQERFDLSV